MTGHKHDKHSGRSWNAQFLLRRPCPTLYLRPQVPVRCPSSKVSLAGSMAGHTPKRLFVFSLPLGLVCLAKSPPPCASSSSSSSSALWRFNSPPWSSSWFLSSVCRGALLFQCCRFRSTSSCLYYFTITVFFSRQLQLHRLVISWLR